MRAPTHEEIALLAYQLWQQRGCPQGSPETDWESALRILEAAGEPRNDVLVPEPVKTKKRRSSSTGKATASQRTH